MYLVCASRSACRGCSDQTPKSNRMLLPTRCRLKTQCGKRWSARPSSLGSRPSSTNNLTTPRAGRCRPGHTPKSGNTLNRLMPTVESCNSHRTRPPCWQSLLTCWPLKTAPNLRASPTLCCCKPFGSTPIIRPRCFWPGWRLLIDAMAQQQSAIRNMCRVSSSRPVRPAENGRFPWLQPGAPPPPAPAQAQAEPPFRLARRCPIALGQPARHFREFCSVH